jgi:hypothetical protein
MTREVNNVLDLEIIGDRMVKAHVEQVDVDETLTLLTPDMKLFRRAIKKRLSNAGQFSHFKKAISEMLKETMGCPTDWMYGRIDTPLILSYEDHLKTSSPQIQQMMSSHIPEFRATDYMVKHLRHNTTCRYQSTVDNYLSKTPVLTDEFRVAMQMSDWLSAYGYHDNFGMPITSYNGKAGFAIFVKDMRVTDFRNLVADKFIELLVIVACIDKVGVKRFPDIFIEQKKAFQKLITTIPMRLAATIVHHGLPLKEAPYEIDIGEGSVSSHLYNLRKKLDISSTLDLFTHLQANEFFDFVEPLRLKSSRRR